MKPQELAPGARPRQSSSISNELWYGRLIVTQIDSKGGRRHHKRETPQGGDLNGGHKKPNTHKLIAKQPIIKANTATISQAKSGGLNGGAQEPRSANFSISYDVDLVLPPPCPFDQEKTHSCEQRKCVLAWPYRTPLDQPWVQTQPTRQRISAHR